MEYSALRLLLYFLYTDRVDASVANVEDQYKPLTFDLVTMWAKNFGCERLVALLTGPTIAVGATTYLYDLYRLVPPLEADNTQPLVQAPTEGFPARAPYNPSKYDIVFVVRGEKIPAHKGILCARCEYYRMMFQGGMMESAMKEIKEDEIEPEVFKALLAYLYTGLFHSLFLIIFSFSSQSFVNRR